VTDVDEDDLHVLDRYEGVASGKYKRTRVQPVTADGTRVKAIAYVSTSTRFAPPTRAYLEAVAKTIGEFWAGDDGPVTWRDIRVS
jgi:hypothetical protein